MDEGFDGRKNIPRRSPSPCAKCRKLIFLFSEQPINFKLSATPSHSEAQQHETDGSIYDRARDAPGQRSAYIPPGDDKQETYRLSTFLRFSSDVPVTPKDLAAAGFYYTGYKDRVKCFSCGLCVENWVVGDVASDKRWHRHECDFANGRECGNIPTATSLFSQLLHGGMNVERRLTQPTAAVRHPVPSDEEMNDDPANVVSTQPAIIAQNRLRFLRSDFEFAEITLPEHEAYLRNIDLRRERNRLDTFRNWNSDNPTVTPYALAHSGLFYLGNLDRTQCFSCAGVLRNWAFGDNVDDEHSRHFANCRMVRGTETTNVSMSAEERRRAQLAAPLQEPADPDQEQAAGLREMFRCLQAVNPNMSDFTRRLETFDHRWPGQTRATPAHIARAGFYFLGERDRVKCWYCNGGLQNWDDDDEPWTEHAKWFPSCEFLLRSKGPDFVHKIGASFPNAPRPLPGSYDIPPNEEMSARYRGLGAAAPAEPQESPGQLWKDVEAAMQSSVVLSVLNMGFDRELVKRVLRRQLTSTGLHFTATDDLVDALTREDAQSSQENPGTSSGSSTTPKVNVASNIPSVRLTSSPVQQPSIPTKETSTESVDPLPTSMEIEGAHSSALASGEEISPAMQKRFKELRDERICKNCHVRAAEMVFVPCGHFCCCFVCSSNVHRCPICNTRIEKSIRTYTS